MIKPPSLVREYTWVWSGDPALDAPAVDVPAFASEEARKDWLSSTDGQIWSAWLERLRVARDTGAWDQLVKAGEQPTKFTLRLVPGVAWRKLVDDFTAGKIGGHGVNALTVRLALRGVANLGAEFELKFRDVPGFGSVATEDVINLLDGFSPSIVQEMSDAIASRQAAPSPK